MNIYPLNWLKVILQSVCHIVKSVKKHVGILLIKVKGHINGVCIVVKKPEEAEVRSTTLKQGNLILNSKAEKRGSSKKEKNDKLD